MRIGEVCAGLAVVVLLAGILPAVAAKGDRKANVTRSSPLLEGKVLDLRFEPFAQGIWATNDAACNAMSTIDQSEPGTVLAIFRGLLETPEQICQVYGAEHGSSGSQRAAMNCSLSAGGEALGLVTVRPRGSAGLSVQDGKRPPAYYRFCKKIDPVTSRLSQ